MICHIVLAILCILAVVQDIATRKIKNKFNLLATGIGFACVLLTKEVKLLDAFLGLVFALVLGILLWRVGAIRAGDAKFMWCIGVLKGWKAFGISMICAILAGGVIALGIMLFKKDAKQRFSRLWNYFKAAFLLKRMDRYEAENPAEFPFSIPLALGCVIEFGMRYFV